MDHTHDKDGPGFTGRVIDIVGVITIASLAFKMNRGWKRLGREARESVEETTTPETPTV